MKLSKLPLLLASLIVFSSDAHARGKGNWWGPKDMEERGRNSILNRLELGYNIAMLSETKLYMENLAVKKNPENPADRTVFQDRSRWEMQYANTGYVAGMAFPLVKVDKRTATLYRRSAFSLYTGLMLNIFDFDSDTLQKAMGIQKPYVLRSINGGALIGFDYKYGADALNTAATSVMYSVGAGVYPNVLHSFDYTKEIYDVLTVTARPYLKAELGFYAGIAYKVRVVLMGKNNYVNKDYTWETNTDIFSQKRTLRSSGEINVSVIMMPFSYGWKKY